MMICRSKCRPQQIFERDEPLHPFVIARH
jgi:hypothetical protein